MIDDRSYDSPDYHNEIIHMNDNFIQNFKQSIKILMGGRINSLMEGVGGPGGWSSGVLEGRGGSKRRSFDLFRL